MSDKYSAAITSSIKLLAKHKEMTPLILISGNSVSRLTEISFCTFPIEIKNN